MPRGAELPAILVPLLLLRPNNQPAGAQQGWLPGSLPPWGALATPHGTASKPAQGQSARQKAPRWRRAALMTAGVRPWKVLRHQPPAVAQGIGEWIPPFVTSPSSGGVTNPARRNGRGQCMCKQHNGAINSSPSSPQKASSPAQCQRTPCRSATLSQGMPRTGPGPQTARAWSMGAASRARRLAGTACSCRPGLRRGRYAKAGGNQAARW